MKLYCRATRGDQSEPPHNSFLISGCKVNSFRAVEPFRILTAFATDIDGGIDTKRCMWSGWISFVMTGQLFASQISSIRREQLSPTCPVKIGFLYFGHQTTWYAVWYTEFLENITSTINTWLYIQWLLSSRFPLLTKVRSFHRLKIYE